MRPVRAAPYSAASKAVVIEKIAGKTNHEKGGRVIGRSQLGETRVIESNAQKIANGR